MTRPLPQIVRLCYAPGMKPAAEPDLDRLKTLLPREAVAELLRWWPDEEAAVAAFKRWLPEGTRIDVEALRGWRARGIPRARQTCVMQAVADEFGALGIELGFDLIERLTADRITPPPGSVTAKKPRAA